MKFQHNVKLTLEQAIKAIKEESKYNSTLSLTSELDRGGWVMLRPGRITPGMTHCTGDWVGPSAGLAPLLGLDPWTAQPVASRYTNYTISAHVEQCSTMFSFKIAAMPKKK